MATRRAKVIGNEDLASHPPRSLRSMKRRHPDDETVPSDDIQPMLSQQDTMENVLAPPSQSSQPPLQGDTNSAAQQEQTAEQTVSSQQEGDAMEEHSPACPNKDSHQNLNAESSRKNDQGRAEDNSTVSPSLRPMGMDQPQALPTSQEGGVKDGVCEDDGPEENLEHEIESSNSNSQQEPSVECAGDDKSNNVTKEEVSGLPAKKRRRRRRMGMCGPREKKSHSFEPGKDESEKNNTEGEDERGEDEKGENKKGEDERGEDEKGENEKGEGEVFNNEEERSVSQTEDDACQSGDTGAALVAVEGTVPGSSSSPTGPSLPAGSVTEQREVEAELRTGDCGEKARPEVGEQLQVSMTTSEETDGRDPGGSGGGTCQAHPSKEPGPMQMKDTDMGTPAWTEGCLGDPSPGEEGQKLEGGEDDTTVEKNGDQKEDREDGSGGTDCYHATTTTTPLDAQAESEHQGGDQNSLVQMDSTAGPIEGIMERSGVAAEAETPSEDTGPGGHDCRGEQFWEAAAAPSGSEENGNCGTDHLSPVTIQPPQATDVHDSYGSITLDYVSDSQLNNIVLIEEEVVEGGGGPRSSVCLEDATELVCGLIRELSSLNRTVMATHREFENVRRGKKRVRAPTRRGFGPQSPHQSQL